LRARSFASADERSVPVVLLVLLLSAKTSGQRKLAVKARIPALLGMTFSGVKKRIPIAVDQDRSSEGCSIALRKSGSQS